MTPYEEGYNGFWQSEDINPYRRDTQDWHEWNDGYESAMADHDEYWDTYELEQSYNNYHDWLENGIDIDHLDD